MYINENVHNLINILVNSLKVINICKNFKLLNRQYRITTVNNFNAGNSEIQSVYLDL